MSLFDASCILDSCPGMSLADVRLRLATEEDILLQGMNIGYPHDTAPSTFISTGLDLEDQQCV